MAIPYLTSLDTSPLPDYGPVVVRVELPEATLEMPTAGGRGRPTARAGAGTTARAEARAPEARGEARDRNLGARDRGEAGPPDGHGAGRDPVPRDVRVPPVGGHHGHLVRCGRGVDRRGSASGDAAGRRVDDPRRRRAALGRGGQPDQ